VPLARELSARARFVLTGPDRVRFLHGLLTNDIEALGPGGGCRAAMLTVKGKTLAELIVYADVDQLLLELDPEQRTRIREVLEKHMIMDEVELADVTDDAPELGVYGEDARAALSAALGAEVPALAPYHHATIAGVRISDAPELAMPGFHVFGRPKLDARAIDDAEWEVLRVEAGRPAWGRELDEDRLILEAGMDDAVSFTKGCYLGQEVVARATARGHINRKLVGLKLEGAAPVAAGAKLSGAGRDDAGHVTSPVVSPRLGSIALGYVHRTLWDPGTRLVVHDPAGDRHAEVSALPFRRP
jgi:folate-binding protein YgfZ